MTTTTVSLAQMTIAHGDLAANHASAQGLAREAADRGSDLFLLPELWSSGYDLERADALASEYPGGSFAVMREIAQREQMTVVGSVLEAQPQGIANCAAAFAADGALLGRYRKLHLFRLLDEDRYLIEGDETKILELGWCRAGLQICYDLRFPELSRQYALAGADLLLFPAEWPAVRVEHWRALLRARAIENQCFVLACNGAGMSGSLEIGGHSAIINPWGERLAEGGSEATLLTAELDLTAVSQAREIIPVYQDRREDVYGSLQPTTTAAPSLKPAAQPAPVSAPIVNG
ncbi:MAG: carbon-nitrogen family hydrolase [Anaerolineaceae bacterium]|nr:carbon-nitrogen family hydrolase [Anaerolineaceae bacterium]